jgi:hypothetical protein
MDGSLLASSCVRALRQMFTAVGLIVLIVELIVSTDTPISAKVECSLCSLLAELRPP